MNILFINNHGGGFADFVDVSEGTSIQEFFAKRMSGESVPDYLIRVNRQPVECGYVLQEGDRVSITPTKIHGAQSQV